MFPLHQKDFPVSAEDLASALEEGLERFFQSRGPMVSIRNRAFPELEEIQLDLNGAQLRETPRPSFALQSSDHAVRAQRLSIAAKPLVFGNASLDLTLNAEDVVFRHARDENGDVVLLLHGAADGRLDISIRRPELETLISEIARKEASKHGVIIEAARLDLATRGPRALAATVSLRARRLFMRADIRISAQLEINDQLVARLHELSCRGDGAVANIACGVLAPHLKRLDGRSFNLLALPIGEVQLRDVRLEANGAIRVSAQFGSDPPAAAV
jgi:hypothetical protein